MSRHIQPKKYIFSETLFVSNPVRDVLQRKESRLFNDNNEAIETAKDEFSEKGWVNCINIQRESKNSRGEKNYKFVADVMRHRIVTKRHDIQY